MLQTARVEELSLDQDLGDDERGWDYDVICWIEDAIAVRGFVPAKITAHSAHSLARTKMLAGMQPIEEPAARHRHQH